MNASFERDSQGSVVGWMMFACLTAALAGLLLRPVWAPSSSAEKSVYGVSEAFIIAEAGLERARSALEDADLSAMLRIHRRHPLIARSAFGGGWFEVKIADNDDGDDDKEKDSDGIIVLSSVGKWKEHQVSIRAHVQRASSKGGRDGEGALLTIAWDEAY